MSGAVVGVLTEDQYETAIQLLDEAQAAKLELLVAEVGQIVDRDLSKPLASAIEAHQVNDLLGRTAKATKELDALRRSRVDPLNAEVRHVNGLFKPITDALDALTAKGKKLLAAWQQQEKAREAREREETRRLQEEAAAREAEALARNDHAAAEEASRDQTAVAIAAGPRIATGYRSEEATTTVRERWVFEVVRPDLVPREYLIPDEKKLRAAIAGGVREIPGVSITQEDMVVVRSR